MKIKKSVSHLFIFSLLSLLFVLLSLLVHYDYFRNIDFHSMLLIQKTAIPFIDFLFSALTLLGSSEVTLIIAVALFGYNLYRHKKPVMAVFLYILIYPLELMGKLLIYHPKPPLFLNRYVFDFHLPSSYFVTTNYSYPSGHMARSAFLVTLLLLLVRPGRSLYRKISLSVLWLYLPAMFISRVYLGEHWLSDVFGGTLLGASVGFLAGLLW